MNTKNGIRTTEFWVTIGVTLLPFLAAAGIISVEDVTGLQNAWAEVIGNIATAAVGVMYIISRTLIKRSEVEAEVHVRVAEAQAKAASQ